MSLIVHALHQVPKGAIRNGDVVGDAPLLVVVDVAELQDAAASQLGPSVLDAG